MTNPAKSCIIYAKQNAAACVLARCGDREVIVMPTALKIPVPSDYTGALSELLPQLVSKYGRERVSDSLADCSARLSEVQQYNARLADPDMDREEQEQVLEQVLEATSRYYSFLSCLPEDMRRFLILMGGVTGEEVDELLELEPQVGDELSRLAAVAPSIQAIRPKSYVMPIDPISTRLAQLREFNEITVSRLKKPPIRTAVSLDCPEHMKIDGNFHLTNYDKSIINGVVSILESGNSSFTVPMLYHAMTGKENPTVDEGLVEEIKAKLDTMRRLSISIDLTEEIRARMIARPDSDAQQINSFTIEGYLLPLNKYTGVVNGKRSEMYQIIDTPPLHSYAKMKNQITTVSLELLKAPLNNNATTIPLKTYLLGRIEAMKNQNNKIVRNKILFEAVYRELGEEDANKKRKKRIRDYTEIILTHFVDMCYIDSYEIVREGRTISGVRIFWNGDKEKLHA